MDYISEYYSKKKQNETIVNTLPIEEQILWLEFLKQSDTAESSAERRYRRKTVSLDYPLTNENDNQVTTVLDLLIDNSPTPLETIIHREENDFITCLLPKLSLILDELDAVSYTHLTLPTIYSV